MRRARRKCDVLPAPSGGIRSFRMAPAGEILGACQLRESTGDPQPGAGRLRKLYSLSRAGTERVLHDEWGTRCNAGFTCRAAGGVMIIGTLRRSPGRATSNPSAVREDGAAPAIWRFLREAIDKYTPISRQYSRHCSRRWADKRYRTIARRSYYQGRRQLDAGQSDDSGSPGIKDVTAGGRKGGQRHPSHPGRPMRARASRRDSSTSASSPPRWILIASAQGAARSETLSEQRESEGPDAVVGKRFAWRFRLLRARPQLPPYSPGPVAGRSIRPPDALNRGVYTSIHDQPRQTGNWCRPGRGHQGVYSGSTLIRSSREFTPSTPSSQTALYGPGSSCTRPRWRRGVALEPNTWAPDGGPAPGNPDRRYRLLESGSWQSERGDSPLGHCRSRARPGTFRDRQPSNTALRAPVID